MNQRIENYMWARATSLFEGQPDLMTREQYWEYLDGQLEWELEQHVARNYGDCGAPITGTQYAYEVEQEELRASGGLPCYGF